MRKKIVSLILALVLASLPILLYAAAATITSQESISLGNFAGVSGIVTLNSGDTIATRLSRVDFFVIVNNPSGSIGALSANNFSWTASVGTITVNVETDGLRYRFFAIGGP